MRTLVRNASYREIGGPDGLLARTVPFAGNTMSAQEDADGTYRVYSYATEIARVERVEEPDWCGLRKWVTEEYFSTTTSRQQNLCRAWLPGREQDA